MGAQVEFPLVDAIERNGCRRGGEGQDERERRHDKGDGGGYGSGASGLPNLTGCFPRVRILRHREQFFLAR